MVRLVLLTLPLIASACITVREAGRFSLTDAYSLHPSSRPVPEKHTVGIPVRVNGCEPTARIPDLLQEATGDYDALVEVVIQRRSEFAVMETLKDGQVFDTSTDRKNTCYTVSGVGIFYGDVDHDAELARRQQQGR